MHLPCRDGPRYSLVHVWNHQIGSKRCRLKRDGMHPKGSGLANRFQSMGPSLAHGEVKRTPTLTLLDLSLLPDLTPLYDPSLGGCRAWARR